MSGTTDVDATLLECERAPPGTYFDRPVPRTAHRTVWHTLRVEPPLNHTLRLEIRARRELRGEGDSAVTIGLRSIVIGWASRRFLGGKLTFWTRDGDGCVRLVEQVRCWSRT